MGHAARLLGTALLLAALAGCERRCQLDVDCPVYRRCSRGSCVPIGDATADDRPDADGCLDAPADADWPGADAPGEPAVRALMFTGFEVTSEPLCDLDEDGVRENAFTGVDPVVLSLATGMAELALQSRNNAALLDVHLVPLPVPAEGTFQGAMTAGRDCDGNSEDNALGGEIFDAHFGYYDQITVEPRFPTSLTFDNGSLEGRFDSIEFYFPEYPLPWPWRGGRLSGRVSTSLAGIEEGVLCVYCRADELAALVLDEGEGLSILDVIVDPGSFLRMPGLAGVQPNLDLDGDGLESFAADSEGRVAACVDGDGTVVSSTADESCALDPRFEDAVSMAMVGSAVRAWLLIPGEQGEGCPPPSESD
jgi:hypothetical protein